MKTYHIRNRDNLVDGFTNAEWLTVLVIVITAVAAFVRLEMRVNQMQPEQMAKLQEEINKLVGSGGSEPTGAIIAYWGTNPPAGWMICDGSTIPNTSEYKSLREVCGIHVPDLRAMFLRGLNNDRKDEYREAANRPIGDVETNATAVNGLVAKFHVIHDHGSGHGLDSGPYYFVGDGVGDPILGGSNETRPNNVAVNWIIKI